jgi:DNA polymerase-1
LTNRNIKKVGQNIKYEDRWTRTILGYQIRGWEWDTQTASHILDNRKGITGLDFQVYVNFGVIGYGEKIEKYKESDKNNKSNGFNRMKEAPLNELLEYQGKDALFTEMLYKKQRPQFNDKVLRAYDLFHDGNLELSKIEANGIHMDVEYYKKAEKHLARKIDRLHNKIQNSKEVQEFGKELNCNSNPQLKELLFDILKYKPSKETKKGNPSTDEEALEKIDTSFVKNILQYRKLLKIKNTYIKNFIKETVNNYMHPSYNLNIPVSLRSSSSAPNFQNVPIREELARKTTRSGIIPREGNHILEVDCKSLEVSISACCHKDPEMIRYLNDNTSDMHRDMAREIFCRQDITKDERYLAKNGFVFPEFYGDYYKNCAESIWERMGEETRDSLPFRTYPKFEKHIEDVEYRFWNEKFVVYTEWKEKTWRDYQQRGYVELFTGFRCTDLMTKNEVLNRPIQGPAFHCLLWSLIQLNKWLRKEDYDSLCIGQIHDSGLFDVVPIELDSLLQKIKQVMCSDIREHWKWLIVPMEIEVELTPIDGNWTTKKEIEI